MIADIWHFHIINKYVFLDNLKNVSITEVSNQKIKSLFQIIEFLSLLLYSNSPVVPQEGQAIQLTTTFIMKF